MKEKKGKILVTAGPTIEPLDPVRFISNFSTGSMGYELVKEAGKRAFEVCLISGPSNLEAPRAVKTVNVTTAQEMENEIRKKINKYDCIVMASAVCDFRPAKKEKRKIKKHGKISIDLIENPDILAGIGKKKNLIKVGFALETEDAIKNGLAKLRKKSLDLIVVNTISKTSSPFGADETRRNYVFLDSLGGVVKYKGVTKKEAAAEIIKRVRGLINAKH